MRIDTRGIKSIRLEFRQAGMSRTPVLGQQTIQF
jgi:hypothetical protein